jgi:hypothetical protein
MCAEEISADSIAPIQTLPDKANFSIPWCVTFCVESLAR